MDDINCFTERLKSIIGERSLRSFAKEAGISDSALRQYLSGKSEPTRPVLMKLAKAGDVILTWLITGSGFKAPGTIELSYVNLEDFIRRVLDENRMRGKGKNSDSIYLACINNEDFERLEQIAINAATVEGRPYIVIDATGKTNIQIVEEITGRRARTNYDAGNELEKFIVEYDNVIIFRNISKSKIQHKPYYLRGLVKILDDAHFDNVQPAADLVFVDYASLLEKSWDQMGAYVKTNIISGFQDRI